MASLLEDLKASVTEVLERHQQQGLQGALVQALTATVETASQDADFSDWVCQCFNAVRVA
jgi:hypothetical protein